MTRMQRTWRAMREKQASNALEEVWKDDAPPGKTEKKRKIHFSEPGFKAELRYELVADVALSISSLAEAEAQEPPVQQRLPPPAAGTAAATSEQCSGDFGVSSIATATGTSTARLEYRRCC